MQVLSSPLPEKCYDWLLFENSALICGVLDKIFTFGIQTKMYGICIHNWTKFQRGTARDTWRWYYEMAMLPCQGE